MSGFSLSKQYANSDTTIGVSSGIPSATVWAVDASSNNVNLTLPTLASTNDSIFLKILRIDSNSNNAVYLLTGDQVNDGFQGDTSFNALQLDTGDSLELFCNNTTPPGPSWYISYYVNV
jgi:hypothetical protein